MAISDRGHRIVICEKLTIFHNHTHPSLVLTPQLPHHPPTTRSSPRQHTRRNRLRLLNDLARRTWNDVSHVWLWRRGLLVVERLVAVVTYELLWLLDVVMRVW